MLGCAIFYEPKPKIEPQDGVIHRQTIIRSLSKLKTGMRKMESVSVAGAQELLISSTDVC